MLALLTVTFSALKGSAIAVAAVNAAVLAAVLICLFFAYRKKETEPPKHTFFDPPATAPAAATEPAAEAESAKPAATESSAEESAAQPEAEPEAGGQKSES